MEATERAEAVNHIMDDMTKLETELEVATSADDVDHAHALLDRKAHLEQDLAHAGLCTKTRARCPGPPPPQLPP